VKTVYLYGKLYPNKIKDVKEITSCYDNYPCEVCKNLDPHRDLVTGELHICNHRKNRCWKMGRCKHFERAGETAREAREWRKLESWR